MNGNAWLFTFPFSIFVDRESPLRIAETTWGDKRIRFYPPFRSAPADFTQSPAVDPHAIPFAKSAPHIDPKFKLRKLVVYPLLQEGKTGTAVHVVAGSSWKNPPRSFPMDSLRCDT
jgi:hypothetical protein